MTRGNVNVGVVGATGAVGREMLETLASRGFPVGELRAFASERSEGDLVPCGGEEVRVERLDTADIGGLDLVLFSAGAAVSSEWAPRFAEAGSLVVDNSSAWRGDPGVPLVIPEINAHAIEPAREGRIVANPNCSTIVVLMAVAPLAEALGLRSLVVSTYQSVSGAGRRAMDELRDQSIEILNFRQPKREVFAANIAWNCIAQIGDLRDDGATTEEWKMVTESQKILELPELEVSCTCVRVPVFIGHGAAVHARFERNTTVEGLLDLLGASRGLRVHHGEALPPLPTDAAGVDEILVGRLRVDPTRRDAVDLWVVGDNLRKGAALNAVQIAETAVEIGLC
jgi:aspartate-semialdehyde dehydrogenase